MFQEFIFEIHEIEAMALRLQMFIEAAHRLGLIRTSRTEQ